MDHARLSSEHMKDDLNRKMPVLTYLNASRSRETMNASMNPIYFETHFQTQVEVWPYSFAIITAYATTGQAWTAKENGAADRALEQFLMAHGSLLGRVVGYSLETGHKEPGWAARIDWNEACDIGLRFKQDAIYFIQGEVLSVTYCDERREMIQVGPFSERLMPLSG